MCEFDEEYIPAEILVDELEFEIISEMGKMTRFGILEVLIIHLLKFKYQPEHQSNSWMGSIRMAMNVLSKKKTTELNKMKRVFDMDAIYSAARDKALKETGLNEYDIPEHREYIYNLDFLTNKEKVQQFLNDNWNGDENVNYKIDKGSD